jgi:hypothetical protein
MMEKAAYIKGLADGMELKAETKEDKMIIALLSLVEEMAETIDEMKGKMSDLEDYVEELDEDLGEVEEILLEELGDEDEECDGDCESCCLDCDLDDEEEYDDEYFEVVCPACGDVINFDATIDPENLACPNCGEKFECIVEEEDLKALEE